jgi:hypothetical protein
MGNIAHNRFDHGCKFSVLAKPAATGAADLHGDDKSERLIACVFLKFYLLLDAVIGNGEIVGRKGIDKLAGFGPDQYRDKDQGRSCADEGSLRSR